MNAQIITKFDKVSETEKALQISVNMLQGSKTITKSLWLPKGSVKIEGSEIKIQQWLISKNESSQYRTYFKDVKRTPEMSILVTEF